VLKAMRDELQRSMTLHFNSLDKPYYLEYMMEDGYRLQISAMLGGIVSQDQSQFRIPRLRLRIGTPQFDNTNYAAGRGSYSMRMAGTFPLDDDYAAIRHAFWLSTDQAYKAALETISRKHAALKNISVTDALPDFSPAAQAKILLDFKPAKIDPQPWASHIKAISAEFLKFPELRESSVDYSVEDGARRFVTSEGGELHLPAQECELRMQATAQAKDGMTVRDSVLFESLGLDGIPSREALLKVAEDLGATVTTLAKAPRGDDYSGPVIFDGIASAQLMAELLGRNLAMTRRPVVDSGAGGGVGGVPASELEGRIGVRILPESFWVRDDPTLKEWKGQHLFGTMKVDEDGVEAKPLSIIEKGVLKTVFLTRQPVRGFPATNARARLQGPYGSSSAAATNLIVESREVVAKADLKAKMIDMLKQRDKPFGYLVRMMDFPSSASGTEVRRLIIASARSGGSRPVSLPLRIYRVYQDGHEEMVRGLRFRALNVRSLKDIVAAADDSNVLNYPENGQPFAMLGAGGETAETSVIAPSLLIDDLELTPLEEEQPKLPIVPAPELSIAMWDRLQPVRTASAKREQKSNPSDSWLLTPGFYSDSASEKPEAEQTRLPQHPPIP
jgi:hypothetical protein